MPSLVHVWYSVTDCNPKPRRNAFAQNPPKKNILPLSCLLDSFDPRIDPHNTPSCSPGKRFILFCSQLSRSLAASFCSHKRSQQFVLSKLNPYSNSSIPRKHRGSHPTPAHPDARLAPPPEGVHSHNTPPSNLSSACPFRSPISRPQSSSSLSGRVVRSAALSPV